MKFGFLLGLRLELSSPLSQRKQIHEINKQSLVWEEQIFIDNLENEGLLQIKFHAATVLSCFVSGVSLRPEVIESWSEFEDEVRVDLMERFHEFIQFPTKISEIKVSFQSRVGKTDVLNLKVVFSGKTDPEMGEH